jgi:hypothetical protein
MKLLIIKIFGLTDISDKLKKAKENQKKLDEKYWKEQLEETILHLNREHELELQEKDATIAMLEDKVKTYKARETELNNREYTVKKEAKENAFMATSISMKVEDFAMKILDVVGEMKGVKDEAENNRKRIEKK